MWSNVVFSVFCRLLNQCFTLFQRELRVWRGTGTESTVAVNTANTKQVKSGIGGLNIANMWHLDIKARLIIILVVLYKWSRVYVCGKHSFIHTHTKSTVHKLYLTWVKRMFARQSEEFSLHGGQIVSVLYVLKHDDLHTFKWDKSIIMTHWSFSCRIITTLRIKQNSSPCMATE